MFKRLAHFSAAFFIAFFWLGLGDVQAAACNWTAGSSAWETDENWSCGHAPTADDDVVIDATGVTVTINAGTTVNSLTIGKEDGSVTSILNFNYDAIVQGDLVVDDGNLVVHTGGSITHSIPSANTIVGRISIDIQSGTATVEGSIDAANKGYRGVNGENSSRGYGPGGGGGSGNCTAGKSGASHGGLGAGGSDGSTAPGVINDSFVLPINMGSGGGGGCGQIGGNGGGAIQLEVEGDLLVNGLISADASDLGDNFAGGGSGGSIFISTNGDLSGTGTITAEGGTGGTSSDRGGAGGGGIIMLKTDSSSLGSISATSVGGALPANRAGGPGVLIHIDRTGRHLYIRQGQSWPTSSPTQFNDYFGSEVENVTISNNSVLTLGSNNVTSNSGGYGWVIDNLQELIIDSGSGINMDSQGYRGVNGENSSRGYGPGGGYGSGSCTASSGGKGGGGHGGAGAGGSGAAGGGSYDLASAPVDLGSGGGGGCSQIGSNGGGAVKIVTSHKITVNGFISANGGNLSASQFSGGGAGGSIWLITDIFDGSGSITANGGNGGQNNNSGGAGGGGRIAIERAVHDYEGVISQLGGQLPATRIGAATTSHYGGNPTLQNHNQYLQDGTTAVDLGGLTNQESLIIAANLLDGDPSDTLTLEAEVLTTTEEFTGVANYQSEPVSFTGEAVRAQVEVLNLITLTDYHWQVRACDLTAKCSAWFAYGNNASGEADFSVLLNRDPSAPASLGPTVTINGGYSNLANQIFQFILADDDPDDLLKYKFQLASDAGFSNLIIDYTSGYLDQGVQSFTVGQAAGTGSYELGSEGQSLNSGSQYYWRISAIDEKLAISGWSTAPGTPSFTVDLNKPAAATEAKMKRAAADQNFITEDAVEVWTNSLSPLFAWTAAADTGGSNLKGYCLYLGTDSAGDPGTQKGLLGSSPVSATGSTCQFIVDTNQVDLTTTALRGNTWLTSSKNPYYLRIRAIDRAHNLSDDTDEFAFYFDNQSPTNVKAISAASGNFSNIADMYFNWPTNETQGASDAHAGVLGFQYAFNDTSTWRGSQVDPSTGLAFIPPAYQQPYYLSAEDDEAQLEIGANVIYFRTIDLAGNISSTYSTASVNYGGEAPSFAFDASVTVTPSENTENSFAVSWSPANPAPDRTVTKYYYMINTLPPGTLGTIKQNSAVYLSTTSTTIELSALPNVRKGANTIYVLAIDDIENYSPSNFISAEFTLNSELPDPPQNLTVADSSVKSASIWRAALAWGEPAYKGTGSLTYQIQRSTDGETWSNVSTTNGTAFVDTVESSSQYYWRVGTTDTSDDSIGSPSFANAVTLTPKGKFTDPPSLTSGPAASDLTTKRSKISWTTSRTADSKVAFGLESGSYYDEEPSNSDHVTDHVINLNNLEPGTTYYYKAKWTDEDGNTGESSEKTFKTSPAPTVQDIAVRSIGLSSAIIEFTTKDSTKAQIYYGNSTSFGGVKTISTSTIESTHTVELTELDDDTKYYFKINLFDSEDSEYDGSILDFTTMPAPRLSNVRIQQVKNTAQSTLSVSWESNTEVSSIVTYYPEGSPEYAQDEVDVKLTADQHEMLITGLLPDTPYILVVRGRDKIGNEAVSDSLKFTTATDTRPPLMSDLFVEGTSLSATPSEDNPSQLIISWTTDEPATSQVEFGEGTSDSYAQLTQQDTKLSYNHLVIIPNLAPAKVYHLRAISVDSAGNEARSVDTVTITPKATDNALELVINSLREAFGFLGGIAQ